MRKEKKEKKKRGERGERDKCVKKKELARVRQQQQQRETVVVQTKWAQNRCRDE